jgi:dihydroorotate dehydrogenase
MPSSRSQGSAPPNSSRPERVPDLYPIIRPLLRALPPETAHRLTLTALAAGLGGSSRAPGPPVLRQRLWGLDFPNPVGIAAGFDKDARAPEALLRLGFGCVEIGTVTPRPQPGNPRPRVFRLEADGALINRMGFNSGGLDRVIERLRVRRREAGIVGVNVGKNRDSEDASADYAEGVRRAAPLADYLVVNVSSPNTPGLRDLQARAALETLLRQVLAARDQSGARPPLLVKIAPDLTPEECVDIAAVALATGIDGIIVNNTTIARPPTLSSPQANEAGGLSGRPLFEPSTALLADIYRLTEGRLPLIGVGGVASAEDAYAKIRAGASLVQLYTALVFAGPALLYEIKAGLAALLRRDGFASLADAVGADHAKVAQISIGRSGAS